MSNDRLQLPDWFYDPDPSKWPPEARAAYSLMGVAAQRRLARQQREGTRKVEESPDEQRPDSAS